MQLHVMRHGQKREDLFSEMKERQEIKEHTQQAIPYLKGRIHVRTGKVDPMDNVWNHDHVLSLVYSKSVDNLCN